MSSSMNCCEIKTIVLDDVARYLAISVPWSPWGLYWPVELFNPSSCTIGGYSAVGITRVENHSIVVLFENFVDPEGTLILIRIVSIDRIVAL